VSRQDLLISVAPPAYDSVVDLGPDLVFRHRRPEASLGDSSATNKRNRTFVPFLFATVATCSLVVPALQVELSSPAVAATASPAPIPTCPPDCGRVAAGDPLLVPYMTSNPGPNWLALPDTSVQLYVQSLRAGVDRIARGTVTNVAAARWSWRGEPYGLLIVLVSSASLRRVDLQTPAVDAQDLCQAQRGHPASALVPIAHISGSVSGVCDVGTGFADLATFVKANVAVLVDITTTTRAPVSLSIVAPVARLQYVELPAKGVLVSSGFDLELVALWACIMAAVAFGVVVCARRRGSWRGPFQAAAEAFRRRQLALAVSVLGVIGGVAFSMVNSSLLHGFGQWFEASFNDFWTSWASAADMTFGGGFGHVFVLDRALETAPGWLVVIAPVARVAFNLSFPYPGAVLYPTAYWVAGPLFMAAMALPICAADRWLCYMGVTDVRRRAAVLGTMAICLPPIALYGHPEDMVALGAVLYGLIAALEGRHRAVGWWLGVALAFQFLAVLAVPVALVLLKRRQWLATLVPVVAVPFSVMVVPLISQPRATFMQIAHQQVYDDFGFISPTWHLDPGVGAFVRLFVALAALPAAWALSRALPAERRQAANLVVWVMGGLFALRVLEPELVPYFLAPTLALLPVSASRGPWWRLGATCAAAVWLNWWLHDPVGGRWPEWLFLLAQLVAIGWLALPAAARRSDDARAASVRRPASATTAQGRRPRPVAPVG